MLCGMVGGVWNNGVCKGGFSVDGDFIFDGVLWIVMSG
jgi:hypothetical protein